MPFPIFIGNLEFSTKESLILVIGLGLSIGIVAPIIMNYEIVNVLQDACPLIKKGDSQAVIDWKNSCFEFKNNATVTFPLVVSVVGFSIMAVGLGIYFYEKRKQQSPNEVKQ